jgi:hypothetical protein
MAQKKRLLAIDLGYSSVKVAYYDNEGVLQFDKFISATAKIPEPKELDDEIVFQLGMDYYVLGPSALKVPRSYLMPLETYDDMKAVYPAWISYLTKYYKQKGLEFDHIIIGLSMAFVDKGDDLLQYLYDQLFIDTPGYFLLLSQAAASRMLYNKVGLDIRNSSKHTQAKLKNYLLLDVGFNTADLLSIQDGKASAGGSVGIPKVGVCVIAYGIMDYIYKEYEFRVSLKEAQQIVDEGSFIRRGRTINLHEKVNELSKKYLLDIVNLLEDKFSEALDVADGILLIGGISYIWNKFKNDPELVKSIEKHFPMSFIHTPEFDGEYYNCTSYLKIIEEKLG